MPEAKNTCTSPGQPFPFSCLHRFTPQKPSLLNRGSSRRGCAAPCPHVGTGLVQGGPVRDERPPPPCWHRTPSECEGLTREVMKSSLVSMSGVRRHARNLREVLDWRSCRTPGERQTGLSILHRAMDGTERDLRGALPTSSVGSGQSIKLYFPMATSIGKRS